MQYSARSVPQPCRNPAPSNDDLIAMQVQMYPIRHGQASEQTKEPNTFPRAHTKPNPNQIPQPCSQYHASTSLTGLLTGMVSLAGQCPISRRHSPGPDLCQHLAPPTQVPISVPSPLLTCPLTSHGRPQPWPSPHPLARESGEEHTGLMLTPSSTTQAHPTFLSSRHPCSPVRPSLMWSPSAMAASPHAHAIRRRMYNTCAKPFLHHPSPPHLAILPSPLLTCPLSLT